MEIYYKISGDTLTAIANSIRTKNNSNATYKPSEMAAEIEKSNIYMTQVTPEVDSDKLTIQHNLGTTDILMAAIFAETLGEIIPSFNGTLAKFWAKTDIPVRYSSSGNTQNYDLQGSYSTQNANITGGIPTSTSYWDYVVDNNNFTFSRTSAANKFIAGVTYTVIIVASNAKV